MVRGGRRGQGRYEEGETEGRRGVVGSKAQYIRGSKSLPSRPKVHHQLHEGSPNPRVSSYRKEQAVR
jgi:hypothetical protein